MLHITSARATTLSEPEKSVSGTSKYFSALFFLYGERYLTPRTFRFARADVRFSQGADFARREVYFIIFQPISGNRYFPFARHPFDPLTSSRSLRDWYWRSQFAISTTLFARRDVRTRAQYGHCWQRKRNSICRFRLIPSFYYTFDKNGFRSSRTFA